MLVVALGDHPLRTHPTHEHDRVCAAALALTVPRSSNPAAVLERFGFKPHWRPAAQPVPSAVATDTRPIPKILHHIWLGGPIPEEFKRYREGWIEKHPGWEFRLWNEDNLPPMINRKLFDEASHPAEKSDILRLELLVQFGGLYVDTDFECLKNVEPLLAGETCVLARMTDKPMTTGFMACRPGEPFFKTCVDSLSRHVLANPKANLYLKTGPGYINRFVRSFPYITVLEPHLVYPFEPRTPEAKKLWAAEGAGGFPDSYAAHHWAGSWLKK